MGQQNEGNCRSIPRKESHPRCCHCTSLFQRRPTTSHQRCRSHIWHDSHENHQRTNSRSYCIRIGQEGRREEHPCLRSWWRYLRCFSSYHQQMVILILVV